MPFNATTKRLEALWAFVDQFQAGDAANRSTFDQVVQDLIESTNALAEYIESLFDSGDLIDERYLGPSLLPPTSRASGALLQVGDFYNSTDPAERPNVFYIWDGSAYDAVTDFPVLTPFFRSLAAGIDQAAVRGLLGLGTAATQNSTAFAAAADVSGLATTLQLAASGLSRSLTDWDTAHTTGPGCGFFKGDAAALHSPAALNTVGVYLAYDANSGLLIASTPSDKKTYLRWRSAGVWDVSWTTLAAAAFPTGVTFADIAPAAITDSVETLAATDDDAHFPTNAAVIDHIAAAVAAAVANLGYVSLGTISTAGGTTQSLSGLNLTGYKFLRLVFQGVSGNGAAVIGNARITIGGENVTPIIVSDGYHGIIDIALNGGTLSANLAPPAGSTNDTLASNPFSGDTAITTASTSIAAAITAGAFNGGQILVYATK